MTEQEFFKEAGKRIRNLRKISGLTQGEVAQKAGIHQADLSTFESKGERIKSADIIRRIVEATGHTMGDLFVEDVKKKHLEIDIACESGIIDRLQDDKEQPFVAKFTNFLKLLFSMPAEIMDEVVDDNIREDNDFLEEVHREISARKNTACQAYANQKTE